MRMLVLLPLQPQRSRHSHCSPGLPGEHCDAGEHSPGRRGLTSLGQCATLAASGLARNCPSDVRVAVHAVHCTSQGGEVWLHLGDCQRLPPRALRAERARPSAAGVGSRPSEARCTAQSGEVWLHLTYQERPPPRVSRAERARPEAAGVL
ncbi:hypothetical protein TYRP_005216, partial [Tyrophagus putrescentiae]